MNIECNEFTYIQDYVTVSSPTYIQDNILLWHYLLEYS